MRLFDTHVHLSDRKFDENRTEVIDRLLAAGVEKCIDVACDLRDVSRTTDLAARYDGIYSAYGMHPHYAGDMTPAYLDLLTTLLSDEKCVALGEIGLDYHYDFSPREVQREWFALQLELAQERDIPAIFHIREAFGDCMDILRAHKSKGIKAVMHCFSGSYETARECLDMGMYIAFGGSLTFNNAHNLRDTAKRLPLDRLLIETDCPYMSPVPLRGTVNEPKNVALVAELLSQLHGISTEQAAGQTFSNAEKLFFGKG